MQRIRMLVYTAPLLTHDDRTRLCREHPSVAYCFGEPLREAIERRTDRLDLYSPHSEVDQALDKAFDDALHFALELEKARDPPSFAALALRMFGTGYTGQYARLRNVQRPSGEDLFAEGTLCDFWEWKPEAWGTPSHEELSAIEALLSSTVIGVETFYAGHNTKWHFSAAAVTINYCKSLIFPLLTCR
jgi:hypothetical protein